eukprot:363760-Chlamydomonas_euryale.AAC.12
MPPATRRRSGGSGGGSGGHGATSVQPLAASPLGDDGSETPAPSPQPQQRSSLPPGRGLRVAFLHPDLGLGGAERLVVDAAAELSAAGHEVDVYTAYYDPARCFQVGGGRSSGRCTARVCEGQREECPERRRGGGGGKRRGTGRKYWHVGGGLPVASLNLCPTRERLRNLSLVGGWGCSGGLGCFRLSGAGRDTVLKENHAVWGWVAKGRGKITVGGLWWMLMFDTSSALYSGMP